MSHVRLSFVCACKAQVGTLRLPLHIVGKEKQHVEGAEESKNQLTTIKVLTGYSVSSLIQRFDSYKKWTSFRRMQAHTRVFSFSLVSYKYV